jgi:hypothetical protein
VRPAGSVGGGAGPCHEPQPPRLAPLPVRPCVQVVPRASTTSASRVEHERPGCPSFAVPVALPRRVALSAGSPIQPCPLQCRRGIEPKRRCQCEAGIPLDCPWQRCAAHRCTCLSTLACRVRHWLEPRSLTSERSGLRPSWLVRDAAVRCHSVRDTCSTVLPARSLPRRRMRRAVLAKRNHTRRRNALLIAALSARAPGYIRYSRPRTRVHKVQYLVLTPAHAGT